MEINLTTENVGELFETSNRQIRDESSTFHRFLMSELDWRNRLICIKGDCRLSLVPSACLLSYKRY